MNAEFVELVLMAGAKKDKYKIIFHSKAAWKPVRPALRSIFFVPVR